MSYGREVFGFGEEGEVDAAMCAGQRLPDLVGGEAEDGRGEAGEGVGDLIDGGLRAAAGDVEHFLLVVAGLEFDGVGVEAVFEYVEVEGAELDELRNSLSVIDAVEFQVSA